MYVQVELGNLHIAKARVERPSLEEASGIVLAGVAARDCAVPLEPSSWAYPRPRALNVGHAVRIKYGTKNAWRRLAG